MKGQRFPIVLSNGMTQVLRQWIGHQRFIYNAKVQEDRYFRTFARKSLQHVGHYAPVDQQYAHFKKEAPFLKDVPSQILRNGATRWKQAYDDFFRGAKGRPTIKTKHGRQAVWITKELFQFKQTEKNNWYIVLGTKAKPLGAVRVVCDKAALDASNLPASISLSVHVGRWYVGFATADLNAEGEQTIYPEYTETLAELKKYTLNELEEVVNGVDRGVVIPACDSKECLSPDLWAQNEATHQRKEINKRRYQRKMARQVKYSKRYQRTKQRIARIDRYKTNCRDNQAHQLSHRLTADRSSWVVAVEQLNVKGMTARAKGKNVRQKSGLNRSILQSGWGILHVYLKYKAFRRGKLFISVPPQHTSQECSACGTIDKAARINQSHYACNACGFTGHADRNASCVIAKHAAWAIYQHLHSGQELSTSCSGKKPKSQTPVELRVSRDAIKSYHAHNRETGNRYLNALGR